MIFDAANHNPPGKKFEEFLFKQQTFQLRRLLPAWLKSGEAVKIWLEQKKIKTEWQRSYRMPLEVANR